MRLHGSKIGLLACMVGLTIAADDARVTGGLEMPAGSPSNGQAPVLEFPGDQFATVSNIFRARGNNKVLSWSLGAGATATPTITRVVLVVNRDGRVLATATPTVMNVPANTGIEAQPTSTGGMAPGGPVGGGGFPGSRAFPSSSTANSDGGLTGVNLMMLKARDDEPFKLPVNFDNREVTLEIGPGNTRQGTTLGNNEFSTHNGWEQLLHLRLEWTDQQRGGKTFSPVFILTNTTSDSRISELANMITGNLGGVPYLPEEISALNTGSTSPATGVPSSGAAGATEAPSSSAGGGGLAIGAIVGIAVGVGVGALAIIGLAVWFFIRRRRNQRGGVHYPVGYSSDGANDGAAGGRGKWDKEVPMVTTDSPQSRYGPDAASTRLHDHRSSMVASGHHDDDATSYAPYSDHTPTPGVHAGAAAAAAGAAAAASQTDLREGATRSPTPPISTRYAHLVEEGMTEDEIRRLEEEERALDAAIEDAGRTSRAAP